VRAGETAEAGSALTLQDLQEGRGHTSYAANLRPARPMARYFLT
jgi:hypothetical protein